MTREGAMSPSDEEVLKEAMARAQQGQSELEASGKVNQGRGSSN